MSDQWGVTPGEQNAAHTGGFGGNINVSIPGMEDLSAGIKTLTTNLQELKTTMASFGQNQHQLGQGVASTMQTIQTSTLGATDSVKTFFQSLTGARPGAGPMATVLDYGLESGIVQDLAMFPLRYLQSTMGQNRQFALNVGGALAGQQYATGMNTGGLRGGMFGMLGSTFGAGAAGIPTGTGEEIAQFMNIARQAGAMVDLAALSSNQFTGSRHNPRAPGFVESAYQMQQMNPAMSLGQIGTSIGGFVANTKAQQQSAYLTGGAFSMVGRGGKLKTITEWAETILRWLESQRPGGDRGKGFTYEQLITQQYPGSNFDAWFDANGVPPDMQEQFWNYALAKARTSSTNTTTGPMMNIERGLPVAAAGAAGRGVGGANPAMNRLRATQPLTQTSFNLAARLSGAFAQREDVNRDFNATIGSALQQIIPAVIAGPLGFLKEVPDPVEEMLMSILERIPLLGIGLGGAVGWGGAGLAAGGAAAGGLGGIIENILGIEGGLLSGLDFEGIFGNEDLGVQAITDLLEKILPSGDVGDAGDWGSLGGTSPRSLHPSMNRKVGAMMKANPRLKINSGRRDEVLQRRLKGKGYSRVSGKSSAHTRGLAADLGPKSEYPWIVANASKFGLKSGAGVGEPWHVGMPGVGDIDIGEDAAATSGIGALLGMFGGQEGGFGSNLGGLMNFLFGSFGQKSVLSDTEAQTDEKLKYDPDFSRKMFAAANYKTGGKYGASAEFWQKIATAFRNKAEARAGVAGAAPPVAGGPTATGATDLAGALTALGIASTGLSSGAMVALLAHHAGFTGTDLTAAVAISERESSFNPKAHRSDVDKALMRGDRGLWQINAGAWNDWLIQQGFIKDPLDQAIFDPWVNAQAARGIWARSNNFSAWSMAPGGWSANGDPFYGTNRNDAEGYVREAGLGDTDTTYPSMGVQMPKPSISGPVSFNNTFVIQGTGGSGGIDTRRMVTMLADQLESEMRRRMARSN